MKNAKTNKNIKIGRKSGRGDGVQLDPVRIKELREEASRTQEEVGRGVDQLLNPDGSRTSMRTPLTTYQRIERSGSTSRKYADALALFLGTTVTVLQGGPPSDEPSLLQRVEECLRKQIPSGENSALVSALEQLAGTDDPVNCLARDVAAAIETTQLAPWPSKVAQLAQLTGWSEDELSNAGSFVGYWLVTSGVRHASKIATSVSWALNTVEEECEEALSAIKHSDVRLTFTEDMPWLRLEISDPRGKRRQSIAFSFVRCVPTRRGLEWQNPTWRDRFLLDMFFPEWAYGHANFVTSGGKSHPEDVRRLRLVIERCAEPDAWKQVALLDGDLENLPEELLNDVKREGASHDLALNWLTADLWEALSPHLMDWAPQYWRIDARAHIAVSLDILKVPYALLASKDRNNRQITFRIRLVEDVGATLRPAPWRHTSVAFVACALSEKLGGARKEAAVRPRESLGGLQA